MNLNFELLNFKFELANLRTFLNFRTSPYRFPESIFEGISNRESIFEGLATGEPKRATLQNLLPKPSIPADFASPVPLACIVSEFCRVDVSTTLRCFNQAFPNACSENL